MMIEWPRNCQTRRPSNSAVLTLTGIVWPVVTAMLVRDYRGALTSYTHRCWLTYQRPWYQRTFLRTASSRARHGDENRLRRTFRIVAALGLAMGVFVLSIGSAPW